MSTTDQYAEAIANRDAARIAFNTATTKKASWQAAEKLDFWQGKVAMLGRMVAA